MGEYEKIWYNIYIEARCEIMIKTNLNSERILASVTASSSFEGLNPSRHSNVVSQEYMSDKISGEEAIRKINEFYSIKR